VQHLLEFNPFFRLPPSRLLKSSLFNEVRNPDLESKASKKLMLEIDEIGAVRYDAEGVSCIYSLADLKRMVVREVAKV